jgi:hypothetical protein
LIDAIRNDKPFNEVKRSAEASLVTAMARRAVHTGRIVTFDEMLKCDEQFATGLESLAMDSPAPVELGPAGIYPTPMPGLLTKREY